MPLSWSEVKRPSNLVPSRATTPRVKSLGQSVLFAAYSARGGLHGGLVYRHLPCSQK